MAEDSYYNPQLAALERMHSMQEMYRRLEARAAQNVRQERAAQEAGHLRGSWTAENDSTLQSEMNRSAVSSSKSEMRSPLNPFNFVARTELKSRRIELRGTSYWDIEEEQPLLFLEDRTIFDCASGRPVFRIQEDGQLRVLATNVVLGSLDEFEKYNLPYYIGYEPINHYKKESSRRLESQGPTIGQAASQRLGTVRRNISLRDGVWFDEEVPLLVRIDDAIFDFRDGQKVFRIENNRVFCAVTGIPYGAMKSFDRNVACFYKSTP